MKDWTGNNKSIYTTLGASSHTKDERQKDDYYATDPSAAKMLIDLEELSENIFEPSCGEGHLSKVFESAGYNVYSSDLINRGYGYVEDFLKRTEPFHNGDIITNPPYKFAKEFVEKSLELVDDNKKVIMFLKLQFLEGKARKIFFEKNPPKTIWVSSSRITCAKNGDFQSMKDAGGSAVCYAWYVWVKGHKNETTIKWFN